MKITRNLTLKLSVFTLLITSLFLFGCGKSVSPTDSALAYFDLSQKDEINTENLPLGEKEAQDFITDSRKLTEEYIRKDLTELGITSIPAEVMEDIHNSMIVINKKFTPKAEEVSKEGDTAIVKLTTKQLNSDASAKVFEESYAKLTPEQQEDSASILKVYQEFSKHLADNPSFSDKDISVEITMKKEGSKWVMASDTEIDKFNTLTASE